MKLTEAKLKQLILEEMGDNITIVTAGGPPTKDIRILSST